MKLKHKLWLLAVDWFEGAEEAGSTTHGFAADQHWVYLFLWAAPVSALSNDQTDE